MDLKSKCPCCGTEFTVRVEFPAKQEPVKTPVKTLGVVIGFIVYTDGSCIGNPGPGGWAYKVSTDGWDESAGWGSGKIELSTNNRMEVIAAIKALENILKWELELMVKRQFSIQVYSDSRYLVNTMNGEFRLKSNLELWKDLSNLVDALEKRGMVDIKWTYASEESMTGIKECHKRAYSEANRM